ncbi:MAG: helix-turn-helix domain-containing protein [Parabacteroides sp.]|nr:helix-turn-helix domain-containing protein [Parabacteroides sp.]
MAKEIEKLNLEIIGNLADKEHKEYIGKDLFVSMSSRQFGMTFLQKGHTYRVDEGRVMRITSGKASCFINLYPYTLLPHMLLIIPPDTIFEIESYDDDFDIQAFSLTDLPQEITFKTCTHFHLTNDYRQLTGEYFHLLYCEVNRTLPSPTAITHLQIALLAGLHVIYKQEHYTDNQRSISRQDSIFHRFLALLNEYGIRERSISFYAGHLCVTPNYLGFVIKQVSGLTVIQWINRHIIQQAKVQLKYSDLSVWQISEDLSFPNPSFFSKFFKKETGISPGEYRKT